MPRDLLADRKTLDGMPQLSRESASSPPQESGSSNSAVFVEQRFKKMKDIHPFAQLLNYEDLDDCDWLEHAAFDSIEAASREKIEYRLRTCGELCSGLFTSAYATTSGPLGDIIKARKFPSIDSSDADRKRVLLAHIIATKTSSRIVTDDAMDYPKDWQTKYQLTPTTGHNEDGETVCIHSLCVHPDFQGQGFGQVLLRSYVQRIKDAGVAKRVALICREKYVKFYANSGFIEVGPSKCQYGGGGWIDMVIELEDDMDEEDQGY
ncbi:hypothetical protein HBI56_164700 [Parastagonospora nodorum]|nr:hypothetical protein HBH53_055670 [Parastagonospora nodorum]KAH3981778.1 hypothetical protein HBH51_039450 [Parastagonospora nodorum]KAH3994940.1 hypothetical protein HBI10_179360 [Parastagonospora nodorum]KAH4014933.1 hypothetical protein HBI13_164490 [Parastagonospora nodorum]KAH4024383.1 hypothetical protein HBI09_159920 [Parastagonospora nodorum]